MRVGSVAFVLLAAWSAGCMEGTYVGNVPVQSVELTCADLEQIEPQVAGPMYPRLHEDPDELLERMVQSVGHHLAEPPAPTGHTTRAATVEGGLAEVVVIDGELSWASYRYRGPDGLASTGAAEKVVSELATYLQLRGAVTISSDKASAIDADKWGDHYFAKATQYWHDYDVAQAEADWLGAGHPAIMYDENHAPNGDNVTINLDVAPTYLLLGEPLDFGLLKGYALKHGQCSVAPDNRSTVQVRTGYTSGMVREGVVGFELNYNFGPTCFDGSGKEREFSFSQRIWIGALTGAKLATAAPEPWC